MFKQFIKSIKTLISFVINIKNNILNNIKSKINDVWDSFKEWLRNLFIHYLKILLNKLNYKYSDIEDIMYIINYYCVMTFVWFISAIFTYVIIYMQAGPGVRKFMLTFPWIGDVFGRILKYGQSLDMKGFGEKLDALIINFWYNYPSAYYLKVCNILYELKMDGYNYVFKLIDFTTTYFYNSYFYSFYKFIYNFINFIILKYNEFDYHWYVYYIHDFIKQHTDQLFNCDLPIFFLFYVLFIFTTIFSFFYLSFLGFYGVFIINLISISLFWISSLISFNDFFLNNKIILINIGKWFVCDLNQQISFELLIDSVSYSFFFLTLTISLFVYMFTFSYFRYEPNIERFTLLLNGFVISMICLVLSGNCFVVFLGWELIGLTSFFLINFWSTKISVLKSAFKAFSFNKLSDVSLFCFLLLTMLLIDDANITVLNERWSTLNNYVINVLGLKISLLNLGTFFLLLSVCIKSAQFGFHLWLPDSMEAPVPASALIHSATLVSAGIFLLLRFTYLFELSVYGFYIIPLIGSFTAFFGGLGSVYQSDSKRILAYSTISHCGFLMVCYSTFIPEYTILYLYVHGFFKAAIFLCLGNIIRFFRNVQDIRRMGGAWKYLPFECFASFVCLINLSGLPFTLGFYIKHLLLLGNNNDVVYTFFILVNLLGGAVFGIIYSFRFFYYIFFDFKKSKKIIYNDVNKKNLMSQYYTNSSLSSNFIISFFIIISYSIIIYLFFIFLNKNSLGEGFVVHSINSSKYEEFIYLLPTFADNIGYFNWFLIILIMLLVFVNWRIILFNYQINFFIFLNFIIFFFIFLEL